MNIYTTMLLLVKCNDNKMVKLPINFIFPLIMPKVANQQKKVTSITAGMQQDSRVGNLASIDRVRLNTSHKTLSSNFYVLTRAPHPTA